MTMRWMMAALLLPGAAAGRPAQCHVELAGAPVIEGACDFEAIADDGSFQVKAPGGVPFVQVLVTTPGEADGYWSGPDPLSTHAHDPLGPLARDGGCWSNEQATVCAD